jgi:hypothetical protein
MVVKKIELSKKLVTNYDTEVYDLEQYNTSILHLRR